MHPCSLLRSKRLLACLAMTLLASVAAQAFTFEGTRRVMLHPRDGKAVEIGSVAFTPGKDGRIAFKVSMHHDRMKDYFLSMREFKCVDGQGEVLCHVPYPYAQPGTVTAADAAWLEHSLLFMFKLPSEFGAKLWNGVYFKLRIEGPTLVGTPQAVDLNLIGAPPARTDIAPYKPALRDDIRPGARWFNKLTIE